MIKKSYNIIIKKSIQFLIKDYKKYFKSLKNDNFKVFKEIQKKQQSLEATAVNSCQSITNANKNFNSLHEELVVHRNIESLPFVKNKDNFCTDTKVWKYLKDGLNVLKIIILDHCNCKSLKLYSDDHLVRIKRKTKLVCKNNWLQILKPYFQNKIKDSKLTLKLLVKKNLIESVKSIERYIFIMAKVYKVQLINLGYWFDIAVAGLLYIDDANQEFSKLKYI